MQSELVQSRYDVDRVDRTLRETHYEQEARYRLEERRRTYPRYDDVDIGVFSPGSGIRSTVSRMVSIADYRGNDITKQGRKDPLPPPEARAGPDGSRHRVYPAPSDIAPPENIDQGWIDDSHVVSQLKYRSSRRLENSLVPRMSNLQIEIQPQKRDVGPRLRETPPPRTPPLELDLPPHVSRTHETIQESQPTRPVTPTTPLVGQGSYVAWEPVA